MREQGLGSRGGGMLEVRWWVGDVARGKREKTGGREGSGREWKVGTKGRMSGMGALRNCGGMEVEQWRGGRACGRSVVAVHDSVHSGPPLHSQ